MTEKTVAAARIRQKVANMLSAVDAQWSPHRQVLDTYVRALSDLDPPAVMAAIDELIQTSERHVPPAKIRRAVLGQTSDGADAAWRFFLARLGQVGFREMRSTDHPDPKAQRALKAIGGAPAMNVPDQELPAVRARFLEAYDPPNARAS